MSSAKSRIIEIFSSIQGEGLWVGKPQVFVRFHGCKLKCNYCDTPLTHSKIHQSRIEFPPYSRQFENHPLEYSIDELDAAIARFNIPSLALTGGEPLEQADFIEAWLTRSKSKYEILLETSGIEADALKRVRDQIDLVSWDIKIPSSTGEAPLWDRHEAFLSQMGSAKHYAKIVYDERITDEEINRLNDLLQSHSSLQAVFQPVSPVQKRDLKKCLAIFNQFAERFPRQVRLIPQTHKFLSVL